MQRIIKVALFLFLAFVCTLGIQAQKQTTVTLKGKVTDSIDALVPFMPIAFTNEARSYTIKTNGDGEYELALDPGKYKVSVGGAMGFDVTRRSEILLSPALVKTLNLKIYVKGAVLGPYLEQGEDDVLDHPARWSYSYQELLGLSAVGVSNGMIRYASKCEGGSVITYYSSGMHRSDGVTFSFDFFTVTADEIRMSTETKEIYAFGNMIIETENKSDKYKGKLRIRIDKEKAVYEKI